MNMASFTPCVIKYQIYQVFEQIITNHLYVQTEFYNTLKIKQIIEVLKIFFLTVTIFPEETNSIVIPLLLIKSML